MLRPLCPGRGPTGTSFVCRRHLWVRPPSPARGCPQAQPAPAQPRRRRRHIETAAVRLPGTSSAAGARHGEQPRRCQAQSPAAVRGAPVMPAQPSWELPQDPAPQPGTDPANPQPSAVVRHGDGDRMCSHSRETRRDQTRPGCRSRVGWEGSAPAASRPRGACGSRHEPSRAAQRAARRGDGGRQPRSVQRTHFHCQPWPRGPLAAAD